VSGDRGLQRERTALAWNRTGLALFVNAVLAIRTGAHEGGVLAMALGIVLLVAAAATVACGFWRWRQLVRSEIPSAPPVPVVLAVMNATWLACAAGLLSIASKVVSV